MSIQNTTYRKIIHLDMDAFFASVEQRDNPSYRGKPLVVGGDPNARGVVAAASYEIRRYGVHSAMSCYEAKRRCPHAIFVRPRFDVYRKVSEEIRQIMLKLTHLVEPLSLDEAYLDVTGKPFCNGSATNMALWLKDTILKSTGLTASAGVSYNKMLAKIASDINKPNGISVITPEESAEFIKSLPIERFHGIGKSSTKRLHDLGVFTGEELQRIPVEDLVNLFGMKRGEFYHQIAFGIDERPVNNERQRKSIGTEITFHKNSANNDFIWQQIIKESESAFMSVLNKDFLAHTVTLKVKYSDFTQITRSHSSKFAFTKHDEVLPHLYKLMQNTPKHLPIRLVGVTYSNLIGKSDSSLQLNLF